MRVTASTGCPGADGLVPAGRPEGLLERTREGQKMKELGSQGAFMDGNGLLLIGVLRKARKRWEGQAWLPRDWREVTHLPVIFAAFLERQGFQLWA